MNKDGKPYLTDFLFKEKIFNDWHLKVTIEFLARLNRVKIVFSGYPIVKAENNRHSIYDLRSLIIVVSLKKLITYDLITCIDKVTHPINSKDSQYQEFVKTIKEWIYNDSENIYRTVT